MQTTGQPFEVALQVTERQPFTTHTPVEAGFDRFPPNLMWQYLGQYAEKRLGLAERDLTTLGRRNPDDETEPFNMAYLALRGQRWPVNGLCQLLHGKSAGAFSNPRFPAGLRKRCLWVR